MRQIYDKDSREVIKRGIDQASNVVKSTLGAKGKTVLISALNRPLRSTKDGVSVAREIHLDNELEGLGAKLVRMASEKTLEEVGDGTTTSALLVQALATEALIHIQAGADPILIKSGIEKATEKVLKELEKQKKEIKGKKEIEFVASISANDPEIGKMLAEIFHEIGKEGVVSIEESPSFVNEKETVIGMKLDKGYVSPYFITNVEKREAVIDNAAVILLENKPSFQEIVPILDELIKQNKRNLLIIAEDFDDAFLAQLLMNRAKGVILPIPVKVPGFGDKRKDYLQDIGTLTGAKLKSESGRTELLIEDVGSAKQVIAQKDNTVIKGGGGNKEDIDKRVKWLEFESKNTASEYEKADLKSRIGKLIGGVALFKVGGATELEIKEKKDRVEDAVAATKAALEEGIVAGGGIALLNARKGIRTRDYTGDERKGAQILINALESPFTTILANAGKNGGEIQRRFKNKKMGYNVREGKVEKDMIEAGIIDPVKVVKNSLINAVSAVGTFITSEYYIVEEKDKTE